MRAGSNIILAGLVRVTTDSFLISDKTILTKNVFGGVRGTGTEMRHASGKMGRGRGQVKQKTSKQHTRNATHETHSLSQLPQLSLTDARVSRLPSTMTTSSAETTAGQVIY
jgi:hypothetical protein